MDEITNGGCDFPEGRIHDLVDGALGGAARGEAEAHLEACDACRALADDLARLRRAAGELPRAIEPPRDLWPAIESRLRDRPARPRWWPAAARLAAAVALIVLGGVLSRLLLPPAGPAQDARPASVAEAPPPADPATPAAETLAAADAAGVDHALAVAEYRRARATLERAVARRRDQLDAVTVAEVERNLLLIDRAIVEIELALTENPGNPRLNDLLLASYRREIDLLRRLAIPS